jgi:hypothetical protein
LLEVFHRVSFAFSAFFAVKSQVPLNSNHKEHKEHRERGEREEVSADVAATIAGGLS